MWDRLWPAPAKLNLFLHITGRRADGYHLLQTVFQPLELADELWFRPAPAGRITRETPLDGVPPEQDLTVRAAMRLAEHTGVNAGVRIGIHKRIPMGGGLGGGSSDAATTLVALNALWELGLSRSELAALGVELGADVPFFIHGEPAWGEGVGERLTTIPLPPRWYLLIVPPAKIATGVVFGHRQLTRNCPPITIADFLAGAGSNVFESIVREHWAEVDAVFAWFEGNPVHGCDNPALTGTGSTVFLGCPDAHAPLALASALVDAGRATWLVAGGLKDPVKTSGRAATVPGTTPWRVHVCRGLKRSPLAEAFA